MVGDVRTYDEIYQPVPTIYIPHAQKPLRIMTFVLRTNVEPESVSETVVEALAELDPELPVYSLASLDQVRREVDWSVRSSAGTTGFLAVLALVQILIGALLNAGSRRS